jgi:hypothetical protein
MMKSAPSSAMVICGGQPRWISSPLVMCVVKPRRRGGQARQWLAPHAGRRKNAVSRRSREDLKPAKISAFHPGSDFFSGR